MGSLSYGALAGCWAWLSSHKLGGPMALLSHPNSFAVTDGPLAKYGALEHHMGSTVFTRQADRSGKDGQICETAHCEERQAA